MHEFLVRSIDPEDSLAFRIPYPRWGEALRPSSVPSDVIAGWGNLRLRILDSEVSFSDEEVGIQIVFETGTISSEQADRIVAEIAESASKFASIPVEVVPM